MKLSIKRFALRFLKITGIVIGSLLLLMILIPYLFPQTINRKINEWANKNINGHISFTSTSLSFFKHFPSLTLTMHDVALMGSAPFSGDTLIASKEISLGVDLSSVFKDKITINKIMLNQAFINIEVDSAGQPNYNIYKQKKNDHNVADTGSGASLGINMIEIDNSHIIYNDQSLPMFIEARGFNYQGSGDLSKDIFALNTHTDIASFDFYYGGEPYILGKKVNADLVTQINTKSLSFVFQKNDLLINKLPVQFNGRFGFLDDGYDMDFKIDSRENDLDELIGALPAAYSKLLDNTEVNGTGDIQVILSGKYIAKDSISPDLSMNMKIRNGYINNDKTPVPVSNLFVNMTATLPGLNPDSLAVNIDSLSFNVGDGYFNSVFRVKGITAPYIYAKVNSEIDLGKWKQALGIKPFDVKGRYSLQLLADGRYATGVRYVGLRKKADTIITSIPKFSLKSSFKDGYFKYATLPQAISNIGFVLNASCPDNNYQHTSVSLDSLNMTALNNYIKGYFRMSNAANFPIDAMLQAKFHMEDLKQFLPVDGLITKGDLNLDIHSHGNYQPAKKKFPVTTANVDLQNGSIQTKYYPHPIEHIQISTDISDPTGSLSGLTVNIKPISFTFEQEPFLLKAHLSNFTNLQYQLALDGNLNIGKIYQVFAKKGYDVKGSIAAHLYLKGKQSDMKAGKYDRLVSKGSLKVNDLIFTSDLYPQPFYISRGIFSFNQDKMRFDTFVVKYAHSTMALNGAVSNVIDYLMKPHAVLNGSFNLNSNFISIDDFMAFSKTATSTAAPKTTSSSSSGVVMVPANLNLDFTANVKKVSYNGMVIKDVKSQMLIKQDSILLKETGFNLIGAPIAMDAVYASISPKRAFFNYHISAKDFDVKKAYNNIKLFHDIATSAAHAEGLISLDYQLAGNLDANMQPVYASLKGGGVLSAEKVKMSGFKLFSAIGKQAKQDSLGGSPNVSRISIKTTIANSIITIDRTKIRIAGFRARLEGQVGFNKALNLQFRLGLPPLGIIGIPMVITGTEDNPKIRAGKEKKDDEVQGTPDSDN